MYADDMIQQHFRYLVSVDETEVATFDRHFDYPPIWRYSSPAEAYEVLDHGQLEPYYMHALFALKNRHQVRSITSVFVTNILLFFDLIEKRWQDLVHDIRPDRSPIWRTVPQDLRERLFVLLQPPNGELARTIESVMTVAHLSSGSGKLLFPELLITQSCSAGTMEHYCQQLAGIVGAKVQCLGENYSASEGLLGV